VNNDNHRSASLIREIYGDLVFLGNALDARDLRGLHDHRIEAVVDLAINEPPAQPARDMIYCRFPLVDGDGNSNAIIEAALRCLLALIENNVRTVVSCSAGMSRSPAVAAAAIAIVTGCSPDETLVMITRNAPHDVSPILWSRITAVYNSIVTDAGHARKPNVDG
jgi:predicted protein tyrosine phosphatase